MRLKLCNFLLPSLGLILAACAPEDQQRLESGARSALDQTQKQLQVAWKAANDKARQLDPNSSKADIERALEDLHKQAIAASTETKKQAESVRAQIERLNLAEKVQTLKADADSKLKDFDDMRRRTQENIDSSEKVKEQVYQDYLKAHAELATAQRAYDEAAHRAQEAWNAATGP